jgi:hypothetical protein
MRRLVTIALFLIVALPLQVAQAQFFGIPNLDGTQIMPTTTLDPGELSSQGEDLVRQVKEGSITLSITPSIPGPNESVEASLFSSSIDLNVSVITWKVNGSKTSSGRGVTKIEFVTGGIGSKINISATIDSPDGVFTKSLSLDLGSVDLLWQGEGYVPPFYKGRTLWGRETRITFSAVPHIPKVSLNNLIYRWSLDGDIVGNSSGVGKNSFTIYDSVLGLTRTVTVDVMTSNDTVAATASMEIGATSPSLLVYEDSPLYGYVFEREVGNSLQMRGKELTLAAFPMFFNTPKRLNSNIIYTWNTNNGSGKIGSEITYRAPDTGGKSQVSVDAQGVKGYLQSADKDFLVQFGDEIQR